MDSTLRLSEGSPLTHSHSSTHALFKVSLVGIHNTCSDVVCGAFSPFWVSKSAGVAPLPPCSRKVGAPKGGGPNPEQVGAPKGGAPKGGGPKFRVFFFPLPPQNLFFSSSLGVFFVEFGWCLKHRGPQMCTFGVLGLSCASPGGPVWWGRRGITRQPKSPNVHI